MSNPAERLMYEMAKTAELIEPISYTSILRKLRKDNPEKVRKFQEVFKKSFETALYEGESEPETIAIQSAIKSLTDQDDADDIVEKQRDIGSSPAIKDQSTSNFGQVSFSPYSDPSEETLIRSASELKVYRCCKRSEVLTEAYWFANPHYAMTAAEEGDTRVFSAVINPKAKVMIFHQPPSQELIQQASIGEIDAISFQNQDFLILNPNVLGNIEDELDRADINDSMIEVGERDNYTGEAPNYYPGSQGMMQAGHGCAAGPTTLPFGLQF